MSGPRGLQLSGTQVIASVLATLTGAIAASYLGVAGTLVGAAVGSIASTTGTEIYKHYLQRSQERLRTAGQVLHNSAARPPRTGNTMSQTAAGAGSGGRHAASPGTSSRPGADPDLADRETAVWDRRQYGATRDPRETQMIPGVATQRGGEPGGGAPSGGSRNGGAFPKGGAPNGDDTASQHAHGDLAGQAPARGDDGRGSLWDAATSFFGGLTRRQWLTYGATAAGFFLLVVAAITVYELTVGKPISAVVYGGHASGTSVGNMLSGHSSRQQQGTTHPASTSSATPAASTPASPTSPAATPSGTPTPSTSVAPSSPSTVPSATPSTGSSGAARSTTTVTPTP